MTHARWAGLVAYLFITFGIALIITQSNHSWSTFPGWAGANLTIAAVLIMIWIRPAGKKNSKGRS